MMNVKTIHLTLQERRGLLKKVDARRCCRLAIQALPLVAILVYSMFSISAFTRQCLILGVLVWVQVFFLSEFFMAR
jgi:hypothetical protein